MVMMQLKASRQCMKEKQKYFLPWVEIFFQPHRIHYYTLKHYENAI